MACNCCTCVSCKRHREKQKLVTSMPVEIRNQTQGATADWFLDRLVELQLKIERLEEHAGIKSKLFQRILNDQT